MKTLYTLDAFSSFEYGFRFAIELTAAARVAYAQNPDALNEVVKKLIKENHPELKDNYMLKSDTNSRGQIWRVRVYGVDDVTITPEITKHDND